ncbi:MAG: carboxymuconolactone decarboxylase family protein [Beijerinckiaceae bacterium]|nr:carboxymuconolactone decarboxylase family protein [Beijerinckiaceae bacterium]
MNDDQAVAVFQKEAGAAGLAFLEEMRAIDPGFADLLVRGVYGLVWSRPGLDLKTRELVAIASLTTLGGADTLLASRVGAAKHLGLSRQEITEVIVQCAIHAGFPAAVKALRIMRDTYDADTSEGRR